METTKNLRALYLAKILYEQTDEDHPLSTNQLIEALQNEFGISASYFQYTGRKQQKLKNSGAEYVCSPWMLVWNGDCYYLLGHTDKHGVTPFRVDRIVLPPHVL